MRLVPSFLPRLQVSSLSFALAAFALSAVAFAPGCTSDDVGCDDAKCGAGNKCIKFEGKTACRRTCTSNVSGQGACPFGYSCEAAGSEPFCVKQNVTLTKAPGQWGAACNPQGGIEANPDCNSAQGFVCEGTSPNDANAYCTREGCAQDRDCGPGFYCGSINLGPNVQTAERTIGPENTTRACLKRSYCAPCTVDLDCLSDEGRPQHCVADDDGKGVCVPECETDRGCPNEAQCISLSDFNVCFPRAGRCAGDGSLCSPCRSDVDCPNGACVQGQYTTEKFCTVKSTIDCKMPAANQQPQNGVNWQCPDLTNPPGRKAFCYGEVLKQVPPNHCHSLYTIGKASGQPSVDLGCWTPDR